MIQAVVSVKKETKETKQVNSFLVIITGAKQHRYRTRMTLTSSHVSTSCVHTYYQIEYALKGNVFSCTDKLRAMSKLMYTLDFSQSSYIHVA